MQDKLQLVNDVTIAQKKIHFKQAKFYITVNDLRQLPITQQEIAVVGRSNAGKSSLINTLTNQNRLAYVSKTPGRTQHINYFNLNDGDDLFLVDLPGYGYAKVPENIREHWVQLLGNYLVTRKPLVGLVLIMDSRHPLKDLDYKMLAFFGSTGKPIHIVLSKSDKLNNQERNKTLKDVTLVLKQQGFAQYSVQMFSSSKRTGVDELESILNGWLTTNDKNTEI